MYEVLPVLTTRGPPSTIVHVLGIMTVTGGNSFYGYGSIHHCTELDPVFTSKRVSENRVPLNPLVNHFPICSLLNDHLMGIPPFFRPKWMLHGPKPRPGSHSALSNDVKPRGAINTTWTWQLVGASELNHVAIGCYR